MELDQVFTCEGWTVRYAQLTPENPSASTPKQLKPVVFVHGTAWSFSTFVPLAKALLACGDYKVLLYDLPGYGQSQEYTGPLKADADGNGGQLFDGDTSVKSQAFVLAKLLEHLHLDGRDGGEEPAVIAHDIAGTIVLRTLLIHNCRFQSLLLMDTNATLPWGDGFYKLARAQPKVFCELPPSIFEATVRAVIRSACFDQEKLRAGWEDSLAEPWLAGDKSASQRSFVRQIAQANDADVAEMLDNDLYGKVSCPVKILWGEKDAWIPREKMDRLADMLKHCLKEFVVVPEAGHLLMIDQPERVAVEVFSWLLLQTNL